MRIALYGLTGDPVTSAHMEIIEYLSNKFDRVLVIPTNINYYKEYKDHDRAMFSFGERYDNLVKKCEPFSNVLVTDIERHVRSGWRFYHTLLAIIDNQLGQTMFKPANYKSIQNFVENGNIDDVKNILSMANIEIYIAMGSDSLQNFKTWSNWENILKISKLIVFNRPGYTSNFPTDINYEYVEMNNDASSTKVRKNLLALMSHFEEKIEEDDFDIWIDDITWAKDYFNDK